MEKKTTLIWLSAGVLCCLIIASAVIIDRKWTILQSEASAGNLADHLPVLDDSTTKLVIPPAVQKLTMKDHDTAVKREVFYTTEGIQGVRLTFSSPEAVAYVAAIDLRFYDIILDTAISVKERTSTFAKRFGVQVAINGEAGETPGMTAPLGQWIGTYIVNGRSVYLKDNERRPFVYFEKDSRGHYSNGPEVIKEPTADMYNAIWGRFDLLQNGEIAIDQRDGTKNNSYSRTIIGIDEAGWKLYLMIVDGRKPGHSLGLNMQECGEILLGFGAWAAMACDQGGSSCMYVEGMGIVSKPADGSERAVYTHIGVRKK